MVHSHADEFTSDSSCKALERYVQLQLGERRGQQQKQLPQPQRPQQQQQHSQAQLQHQQQQHPQAQQLQQQQKQPSPPPLPPRPGSRPKGLQGLPRQACHSGSCAAMAAFSGLLLSRSVLRAASVAVLSRAAHCLWQVPCHCAAKACQCNCMRRAPAARRLLDIVQQKEAGLDPRARGMVLKGLALLDLHGSALVRKITRHPSQWANYHPRHIPTVFWALGKLGHRPPPPVMDILLGHTQASLPNTSLTSSLLLHQVEHVLWAPLAWLHVADVHDAAQPSVPDSAVLRRRPRCRALTTGTWPASCGAWSA